MSQQTLWITFILMGLLTYGLRLSFILVAGRFDLPVIVRRVLNYAPSAVLLALIAPAILVRSGELALSVGNERIWAGLVAAVVAWWTGNILATILTGMITFWLLQAIL